MTAQGQVYWSNTASGDWSIAANWGGTAPTSSSWAYIVNGGTANITQPGAVCQLLDLGGDVTSGLGTVQMLAGSLWATYNEWIGQGGAGLFVQTGGTHTIGSPGFGGELYISYAGGSGSYSLGGAGVLSAADETVGEGGAGAFNQSGGTNTVTNFGLLLGNFPYSNCSGTYTLTGFGVLSSPNEEVGNEGRGAFIQSGGLNTITNNGYLTIGVAAGSSGTYCLSGGGKLSAAHEYVGSSGTGTFSQTGGLNSVGFLAIGSSGQYRYSGGTLQITGGGLANQGVFDAGQYAGALTFTGSAIVDFSQEVPVNTGSMSLSIGANSLLLLPANYSPQTAFASYANLGLTHTVGTTLAIAPDKVLRAAARFPILWIAGGPYRQEPAGRSR